MLAEGDSEGDSLAEGETLADGETDALSPALTVTLICVCRLEFSCVAVKSCEVSLPISSPL